MSSEPTVYQVAVIDDVDTVLADHFEGLERFTGEGIEFNLKHYRDPASFIKGLTYLDCVADAILLDVNFEYCSPAELAGISGPSAKAGLSILRALKRIDPLVPVLMLSSIDDPSVVFFSGQAHADDYIPKAEVRKEALKAKSEGNQELLTLARKIRRAWLACTENPMYDAEHLTIADRFSGNYDKDEQKKVATIAYYHFENEMIISKVQSLIPTNTGSAPLQILDLGCGTGRVERLLASIPSLCDKVAVTAIDFSPGMLRVFREKQIESLSLQIFRGPIESFCVFESELPKAHFDIIIAGFGFLSYVNYKLVLPPVQNEPMGLTSFLKPGGHLLVSVYNEKSLIYDVIARSHFVNEDLAIAAVMDPYAGVLNVTEHKIVCDSFDFLRLSRLLRQAGLFIDASNTHSFPTMHLCLNNTLCESNHELGFMRGGDMLFPEGLFNQQIYDQDVNASGYFQDRGHYWVGWARRPRREV